jgi:hypothetical protein
MDQSIMNFADSTARGSALGTAVAEGMVSYLNNTDRLDVYDGAAWKQVYPSVANAGEVIQVVSTTLTTAVSFTSASFADISGLSATITPRSSSSQMLVICNINGATQNALSGATGYWRLVRDSTAIAVGTSTGTRQAATGNLTSRSVASALINFSSSIAHLDSPATSSAVTYKPQGLVTLGTMFINQTEDQSNGAIYGRTVSNITVLEIAG